MRLEKIAETELQYEPGVRVFASAEAGVDPAGLAKLEQGLEGADLAAPPVALPDFHLKGDKEMPSSIAVATRDTIIQSRRPHCGSWVGPKPTLPIRRRILRRAC